MRIYQARIKTIDDLTGTDGNVGANEIYVAEIIGKGEYLSDRVVEAKQLSHVPMSLNGAGAITTPNPNALCVVYDPEDGMPVNILGYLPEAGTSNYGIWKSDTVPYGGYRVKVGGQYPISMTMSPTGYWELFNSTNSFMKFNTELNTFSLTMPNIKINTRSGYNRTEVVTRNAKKYCSSTIVFGKGLDDYTLTDVGENFVDVEKYHEMNYGVTASSPYSDKVVIRSGLITNTSKSFSTAELLKSHVFELDTRQAVSGTLKDTITCLQVGKLDALSDIAGITSSVKGILVNWVTKEFSNGMFNTSRFAMGGGSYLMQSNAGAILASNPTDLLASGSGYSMEKDITVNTQYTVKVTPMSGYENWFHTSGIGYLIKSNKNEYDETIGTIFDGSVSVNKKLDVLSSKFDYVSTALSNDITLGACKISVDTASVKISFGVNSITISSQGIDINTAAGALTWNNVKLTTESILPLLESHIHTTPTSPTLPSPGLVGFSSLPTNKTGL